MEYSLEQLAQAAGWLLQMAMRTNIVAFYGSMGAGKTTIIKEMCRQRGVIGNVSSPTFALINEYRCIDGTIIYHFDCYRLKSIEEALSIGMEEYLYSNALCLVEWAEVIDALLPKEALKIKIEVQNGLRILTKIN
jgi:tRNA threonylcarbamoyladenosine biosynthesis protein TsaE